MSVPRSTSGRRRSFAAAWRTARPSSMRASTKSGRHGARRQKWYTEFLNRVEPTEANENKLLGLLGYLGWLGASVATFKQAVLEFAVKDAHKRNGQGDPTEKMFRLWMLLGALEKRAPKIPRRLGVAPGMLKWVSDQMPPEQARSAEELFDALMGMAALSTAWFFMLRVKEYCEPNGVDYAMVPRGADLKFEGSCDEDFCVIRQFRKTKTDQDFGTCKTMFMSGVPGLCVVKALMAFSRGGSPALWAWFRGPNASVQVGERADAEEDASAELAAAAAVALPPERFMSHLLRMGGASALFQATGEIGLVERTGRWSSAAVQRCLHDGETALKHAGAEGPLHAPG
eukprot:s1513_g22.t1